MAQPSLTGVSADAALAGPCACASVSSVIGHAQLLGALPVVTRSSVFMALALGSGVSNSAWLA
jgi:hypothetical protein